VTSGRKDPCAQRRVLTPHAKNVGPHHLALAVDELTPASRDFAARVRRRRGDAEIEFAPEPLWRRAGARHMMLRIGDAACASSAIARRGVRL
jgi:hypothetical protein